MKYAIVFLLFSGCTSFPRYTSEENDRKMRERMAWADSKVSPEMKRKFDEVDASPDQIIEVEIVDFRRRK